MVTGVKKKPTYRGYNSIYNQQGAYLVVVQVVLGIILDSYIIHPVILYMIGLSIYIYIYMVGSGVGYIYICFGSYTTLCCRGQYIPFLESPNNSPQRPLWNCIPLLVTLVVFQKLYASWFKRLWLFWSGFLWCLVSLRSSFRARINKIHPPDSLPVGVYGPIPCTDGARRLMRHELEAMQLWPGLPMLFITLNPADTCRIRHCLSISGTGWCYRKWGTDVEPTDVAACWSMLTWHIAEWQA